MRYFFDQVEIHMMSMSEQENTVSEREQMELSEMTYSRGYFAKIISGILAVQKIIDNEGWVRGIIFAGELAKLQKLNRA